jgi:hypothetical protein
MIPSLIGLIVMAIGLVMLRYALIGQVLGPLPSLFPPASHGSIVSTQ